MIGSLLQRTKDFRFMKKIRLYIILALVIGIGVGYFVFTLSGDDASKSQDEKDSTPAEHVSEELTPNEFRLTTKAMALVNIETKVVGKPELTDNSNLDLSGEVFFNQGNETTQVSYFEGDVEKLIADYKGKKVKIGDILAYVYSPDLIDVQQELKNAAVLKVANPEHYKAVRNKLKHWRLTDRQIRRIEENNDPIKRFSIHATVSGTIKEVMVSTGDHLKKGQPILKLSNLNSVSMEFDIDENQVSNFKEGQSIRATTKAFPDKSFEGEVASIDLGGDTEKRKSKMRVDLPNKDGQLKPGMFVEASLPKYDATKSGKLFIPASAVLWTGDQSVIYLKTKPDEPVFEKREVLLGSKTGETYEIIEGLNAGDRIVINGAPTVDEAAELRDE